MSPKRKKVQNKFKNVLFWQQVKENYSNGIYEFEQQSLVILFFALN